MFEKHHADVTFSGRVTLTDGGGSDAAVVRAVRLS